MRCLKKGAWALYASAIAAGFLTSAAGASESSEPPVLVMYEKVGMSGKQVTFKGPVADIDVRFPFHSSSVKAGHWEICTRNDFKGACMDIGPGDEIKSLKKEFGFFARVRSLRPLEEVATDAVALQSPKTPEIISAPAKADTAEDSAPARPVASAAAVLRGHSAHFFKTPMFDGEAIEAGDKAAVREFCHEAGFEEVEFADFVVSEGRRIVGDLLCAEPLSNP